MKRLIIIILLVLATVAYNNLSAQSLRAHNKERKINFQIGAQTNRSIRGWRNGWNVDMAIANNFRVGYFNTSGRSTFEDSDLHTDQGMEMSYMFNSRGRVNFGPQIKATVTDKRFVSIITMVQTRVPVSQVISFKGGVGLSDRYPVFEGGLVFKVL